MNARQATIGDAAELTRLRTVLFAGVPDPAEDDDWREPGLA
jgi:hypothetical protein